MSPWWDLFSTATWALCCFIWYRVGVMRASTAASTKVLRMANEVLAEAKDFHQTGLKLQAALQAELELAEQRTIGDMPVLEDELRRKGAPVPKRDALNLLSTDRRTGHVYVRDLTHLRRPPGKH